VESDQAEEISLETSVSASLILNWSSIVNFKVILLSIVIEALPFVVLSVIVAAILQNFVTEDMISQLIPKNRLLNIVPAALLGMLFPVCDCGMVPVVRRLIMKGVPLPTAITFMLATPIINPVVAAATAYAFKYNHNIVLFRLGTAFFIACFSGWTTGLFFHRYELKTCRSTHHSACNCGEHPHDNYAQFSITDKILRTLLDASNEFFDMGKYLLVGAILGALTQILLPRTLLLAVGQHSLLSTGVMMLFAFFISVCSAADAFIAASFATSFSPGSLVAFMVFGPMIDLKNTFMLLSAFRTRFVLWLIILISSLCTGAAIIINYF
jgi:hypothetical protein